LPKNIESYYQEIGRAGRDGALAETLLFFSVADVSTLRSIISESASENREVHLAKLERMFQFAASPICRRKILLNYFNETKFDNCGNCDVCQNPPKQIDGTVIAQKALSAVARLKEDVAAGMLVDVLRGSRSYGVLSAGYDRIKTYGAGNDLSKEEWFQYLEQLINQGLLYVAYEDHNKLRLTEASKAVLFGGRKVHLVREETLRQREASQKAKAEAATKRQTERQRVRDELFEHLRSLRLEIARQKGVPPYIIFTDATLEEMAAERPATQADFSKISGVGEVKLQEYGTLFLDAIQAFLLEKKDEGVRIAGSTYLETYRLYQQGHSVEEIAQQRELNPVTIYSHLAYHYEKDEPIAIHRYVSKEEVQRVFDVLPMLEQPYVLKEIFDSLKGEMPYEKIRLSLAYFSRHWAGGQPVKTDLDPI
jgi:ATP-dependent DNA helicase RecQ